MRKELINGTLTTDADTGWVETGSENSIYSVATINTEWTAAVGSPLDGEVDIYLSSNADLSTANLYPKHTVTIDAATSAGKDNTLGLLVPFKYIRAVATMNSLTAVDMYVDIVYNKVKA